MTRHERRACEPARHERGATYVEVLVAGVLLAVGLLGLCNMFVIGYARVGGAGKTTAGVAGARQVLEDVKLIVPFDRIVNLNGFSTDTPSSQPASDPEREVARRWRYALAGDGVGWSFTTTEKARWTNLAAQGSTLGAAGSISVAQTSTTLREVSITVSVPGGTRPVRLTTRIGKP